MKYASPPIVLCVLQVHTICSSDDMLSEYGQLFSSGYEDFDDLHTQMQGAFGDSYEYLDPTLLSLVEQAQISATSGPDLSNRQDICSTASFASAMRLDQIVSCLRIRARSQTFPEHNRSLLVCRLYLASLPWPKRHAPPTPRRTRISRS